MKAVSLEGISFCVLDKVRYCPCAGIFFVSDCSRIRVPDIIQAAVFGCHRH